MWCYPPQSVKWKQVVYPEPCLFPSWVSIQQWYFNGGRLMGSRHYHSGSNHPIIFIRLLWSKQWQSDSQWDPKENLRCSWII
jgi:hypothetical protein